MKRYLVLVFITLILTTSVSFASDTEFTIEEESWLKEHSGETFTLGLDPYSGMDYFEFRGEKRGYLIDVVEQLRNDTGLNIRIIGDSTWGKVYDEFLDGDIDILFGANVTEERLKVMDFTKAIHKYPYAVFSSENGNVRTLGDLDGKKVGFIEGDISIELFVNYYPKLTFEIVEFEDQIAGLENLQNGNIDGFVTSGGGIVYDFMYNYPKIEFLFDLENITSDMTLATLKKNSILNSILSKIIEDHSVDIDKSVSKAKVVFNRKILNLSDDEIQWLNRNEDVVVGVVSDYLPFDYYKDGMYLGIGAALINEIADVVGINFVYDYGEFDDVYKRAVAGKVDIINIAKTDERLELFNFPRSFSKERDRIYGDKDSTYIDDIYGLEDKKIAVIKGFWHEDFLKKNLRNVDIVITDSIKESLSLLDSGKVDYFIENRTVAEYYISGLGYWNIIKKGETSQDSFLYFGVNKDKDELSSVIDKTLLLIDYDKIKQTGLETVPNLLSRSVVYLIWIVAILLIIISIFLYIIISFIKTLINEREEKAILKERETMMYQDPLTNLKNRLYYNYIEKDLENLPFPQALIISDLNDLKKINDTLGHHMGDAYIKGFALLLTIVCKDSIICRMGGDEFLIIETGCDAKCAKSIMDNISSRGKTEKIEFGDNVVTDIKAAMGYSIRYSKEESIEMISIQADNMMYENKKKMKSCDPR
ncbi:MAG: transporter substrate-binding domain-containing protein [Acidaminobacteraceae bacterium]